MALVASMRSGLNPPSMTRPVARVASSLGFDSNGWPHLLVVVPLTSLSGFDLESSPRT
jgi:hypothetical protein